MTPEQLSARARTAYFASVVSVVVKRAPELTDAQADRIRAALDSRLADRLDAPQDK